MTIRVGINGFGRIGRNYFRALLEQGADIEIVAVNDLGDTATTAHLLKYDTILGRLKAEVSHTADTITVDGHTIKVLSERNPADVEKSSHVIATGFCTSGSAANTESSKPGGTESGMIGPASRLSRREHDRLLLANIPFVYAVAGPKPRGSRYSLPALDGPADGIRPSSVWQGGGMEYQGAEVRGVGAEQHARGQARATAVHADAGRDRRRPARARGGHAHR